MAGLPEIGSPGPAGFNDWVLKNFGRIMLWSRQLVAGSLPFKPTTQLSFKNVQDAIEGLAALSTGIPLDIQLFTSSDTYTPATGTTKALVIGQAAGGGGGGVGTTSGTGRGGQGGAGETRIGVVDISGDVTVTIGAAGSGGAAGNNAGGTASDATFGSLMTCKGGTGGGGSTGANNGTNGTTPTGSGGIIIPPTSTAINTISGVFRSIGTIFGAPYMSPGTTATQLTEGAGYGAGGVAALSISTTAFAGGDGAGGVFIVIGFK